MPTKTMTAVNVSRSVNPMQLNAYVQGAGFPILCLHGHPGSGQSMRVFTQHLARRFQTIAPDLRGYGKSQTRQDFAMTDHLGDLERVLDRYQIDRCLILGWSLGGIMAMELALQRPDRVSGLILIATSARPWGDHPQIRWPDYLFTGIAGLLNRLKPGWQWNIDTFGRRSLFRYLIQRQTPTAYQYLATDAIDAFLRTSPAATRALDRALQQRYNRLPAVEQINCPTLMLAGAADRHINADSSRETAQKLPNCEWHCYPNTAHLLPWEVPEEILGEIDSWINRHPAMISLKSP
jgi:pimeloyl-ACP methyl ester carboxylesterase